MTLLRDLKLKAKEIDQEPTVTEPLPLPVVISPEPVIIEPKKRGRKPNTNQEKINIEPKIKAIKAKTIQEPVIQTRSQKRKLETVSTRVTRSKKD